MLSMQFVDYLVDIISNHVKTNYNTSPLQHIINEYIIKCYDCTLLLDEEFICKKCNIIRCRFHHYVNSCTNCCVECQDYKTYISEYHFNLYKCTNCKFHSATRGYINNVILCVGCVSINDTNKNIIYFSSSCSVNFCCGTGWFIDKKNNKYYQKHKTVDSTNYLHHMTC